jgi:cell division protein FtsW
MKRIAAFMDPWSMPMAESQLTHSLMAFNTRRVAGRRSRRRDEAGLLPEAHNDFLLAVQRRDGFLGVLVVLLVFAWLIWRAFLIGRR